MKSESSSVLYEIVGVSSLEYRMHTLFSTFASYSSQRNHTEPYTFKKYITSFSTREENTVCPFSLLSILLISFFNMKDTRVAPMKGMAKSIPRILPVIEFSLSALKATDNSTGREKTHALMIIDKSQFRNYWFYCSLFFCRLKQMLSSLCWFSFQAFTWSSNLYTLQNWDFFPFCVFLTHNIAKKNALFV